MVAEPRLSAQTLKVLAIAISSPQEELSGAWIARATKLQSGTLYPILMRLEKAGWLMSRWEDGDPRELGRPRRRLYRITGLGSKKAKAAFDELAPAVPRAFAWA
jgi:PadR family transcriptional regulator, regulatory protein PadR